MSGDEQGHATEALDLDVIEARAKAASPSPWTYPGIESVAGGLLYDVDRTIAQIVWDNPGDHDGSVVRFLPWDEADANGQHIAGMDPATTLALVAEVRRLRIQVSSLSNAIFGPKS